MRILVITNLYPSPRSPAFGTFVASRVKALRDEAIAVDVVALTDARTHARLITKYGGFLVRCLWAATRATVTRTRYDVVEAHIAYPTGLIALPLARLLRSRLVLFAHGSDVTVIPGRNRVHARLAAYVYAHADLVVANSRFIHDELRRRFRVRQAAVVSPGIDARNFSPSVEHEPARECLILYVGRLVETKGVDVLLDAFGRLSLSSAWRLEIIGDGPMRPRLEALALLQGTNVAFLGAVPPSEVRRHMARAAIVVVPSTWQEPLGLVPLEAMAAGALVVASAVGGMRETVRDDETGFSVPVGDPVQLAAGLSRAIETLDRPDRLAHLRHGASRMAARHRADVAARESIAIFHDFVDGILPEPASRNG